MKAPAFQLYANDWLSSTKIALMSPAEEGAYIRLLCHAWNDADCSLPNDDEALAVLSRLGEGWFKQSGTRLKECFTVSGNRLVNERLRSERDKQIAWREKSRLGGINSGKSRKDKELQPKGSSSLVETKDEPKRNTSSSFSSSKKKEYTSDILQLSDLLAQRILSNNPKHTQLSNGKYHQTVRRWAGDIDKLHRLYGQSVEDIRKVIEWCQADSFWRDNILSGAKLREKWDSLYPKVNQQKSSPESWR